MEILTKIWLVASKGGGMVWFNVSKKIKPYKGQWECSFFKEGEKMAKSNGKGGNSNKVLVLSVHTELFF